MLKRLLRSTQNEVPKPPVFNRFVHPPLPPYLFLGKYQATPTTFALNPFEDGFKLSFDAEYFPPALELSNLVQLPVIRASLDQQIHLPADSLASAIAKAGGFCCFMKDLETEFAQQPPVGRWQETRRQYQILRLTKGRGRKSGRGFQRASIRSHPLIDIRPRSLQDQNPLRVLLSGRWIPMRNRNHDLHSLRFMSPWQMALNLSLYLHSSSRTLPITRGRENLPHYRYLSLGSWQPEVSVEGEESIPFVPRRPISKLDRVWIRAYAQLTHSHDTNRLAFDNFALSSLSKFFWFVRRAKSRKRSQRTRGSVIEAWNLGSQKWKKTWWTWALHYALLQSPTDALLIVEDICRTPSLEIPPYVIQDVLDYFVKLALRHVKTPASSAIDRIFEVIALYLDTYRRQGYSPYLSNWSIYTLAKYCNSSQLHTLQLSIQPNVRQLSTMTKLHLMERYVSIGQPGSALELLSSIPQDEFDLPPVQSLCVSILRAPFEVEDLYALRRKILSYMLEIGIRPNRQFHNVILLNAVEAGDRDMAWQSYQITMDNNLSPNEYTYSILLQGVDHGDGMNEINTIWKASMEDGLLQASPFVASQLLDAVYKYNKIRDQPAFSDMYALYAKMFDTRPIFELGLLDKRHDVDGPSASFLDPTARSLRALLMAWLQENREDHVRIYDVYQRYIEHVSNRHPTIAPIAGDTFVPTAFILAFGCHQSSLHMCTTVAQHLIRPPQPFNSSDEQFTEPSSDSTSQDNYEASETEEQIQVQENDTLAPADADPYSTPPTSPSEPDPSDPNLMQPQTRYIDDTPSAPAQESSTSSSNPVPFVHPPNIHIWNALVYVFAKHKKLDAAEQIMQMMRSRGVAPDKMTWDHLINGYSRAQQIRHVVKTVERMGKEKFRPDEWTMSHLNRVVNRTELLDGLEKAARESEEGGEEGVEREEGVGM